MKTRALIPGTVPLRTTDGSRLKRGIMILAVAAAAAAFPLRVASAEQKIGVTATETQSGPYFAVSATLGAVNDPQAALGLELDLGLETGVALDLGYRWGAFRAEGQLLLEKFEPATLTVSVPADQFEGSLTSAGVMANGFFDFGPPGSTRPYIGAGIGFAHLNADFFETRCTIVILLPVCETVGRGGTDFVAAWQVMAGFSRTLGPGLGEWFLGYRYFETEPAGLGSLPLIDGIRAHSVQGGVRLYFK